MFQKEVSHRFGELHRYVTPDDFQYDSSLKFYAMISSTTADKISYASAVQQTLNTVFARLINRKKDTKLPTIQSRQFIKQTSCAVCQGKKFRKAVFLELLFTLTLMQV